MSVEFDSAVRFDFCVAVEDLSVFDLATFFVRILKVQNKFMLLWRCLLRLIWTQAGQLVCHLHELVLVMLYLSQLLLIYAMSDVGAGYFDLV